MKICTLCNKNFRDNYALERHQNKKKPCVNSVKVESNQSQPVVVLNNFGEEDIEHIDIQSVINEVYELNNICYDAYIRAGNIIAIFHKLINENKHNNNIEVKNNKSTTASIYLKNKWIEQQISEIINRIMVIRTKQLIEFKETIQEYDQNFFKIDLNKDMWRHIEAFAKFGYSHNGLDDTTRRVRGIIKLSLIN